MKRITTANLYLIVFSIVILLTLPFGAYVINFHNYQFSKQTETWGQFGDYLNGFFTPIIALTGVIVTFILGIISDKRNKSQLKIEQQKQRPILHIDYFDGETLLYISMINKGIGPLLIKKYQVIDKVGNDYKGLFFIIPEIKELYMNYTGNLNNVVLSPGEEKFLLRFVPEGNDTDSLTAIRNSLKNYKIQVNYNDVYNEEMPQYTRELTWFGRHNHS